MLVVAFSTWTRAGAWQNRLTLADTWLRNHPNSYRSRMTAAGAYAESAQSVDLVYDTYVGAAVQNSAAVIPLLEMTKILHSVRLGGLELPRGNTVQSANGFAEPLKLSDTWIESTIPALAAEIASRLQDQVVEPGAPHALFDLMSCAMQGDPVCLELAPASLHWHRSALDNPRLSELDRARLENGEGELSRLVSGPSND